MIELKTQHPYVDEKGKKHSNLIKHYAIDNKTLKFYKIKQIETKLIYDEAIDIYPCKYNYEYTSEEIEKEIIEE